MSQSFSFDVLIIGSGAAGLTLGLSLPDHINAAIISKDSLDAGSTRWAQGGVAAVLDEDDSVEAHVQDTLIAGAGLCHEPSVRFTVENSTAAIQWLIDIGVPFTQDSPDHFHLTREGGHSARRIIHAADATGHAISDTLLARAKEKPNLKLLQNYIAIDLITREKLGSGGHGCIGAYFLNNDTGDVDVPRAQWYWPPVAPARCICTPATRTALPAMASPWPGAPVAASPIWNSTSSTRPACITRRPSRS